MCILNDKKIFCVYFAMAEEIFTSSETSKVTKLSLRQLQYWDKTDLISPSVLRGRGRGSRRLYSQDDLLQLKVVKKLLDVGMSVQSVRKSLAFLRKLLDGRRVLADLVLVSDGYSIYAYRDNDTILDTLHEGQQVFRLALGELAKEVKNEIEHIREEYVPSTTIRG